MPLTNDLRTWECLEATHRARPTFEMLMVALNALLYDLARDVLDLRQDYGECWQIDCCSIGCRERRRNLVFPTACVKNVTAASVLRFGLT